MSVGGVSLTRTTNDAKAGDSADASKTWVASTVTTQVHNAAHADITNTSVAVGTVVHDSATVDVGAGLTVPASSTFTFHRYPSIDCTGTPADQTGVAVPAGSQTGTAESNTFTTTVGRFSYKVDFVSGNPSLAANKTGDCEPFTVVDANIQISPLTDTDPISDTHVLTGHVNVAAVIEVGGSEEDDKFAYYVKDNGIGFDMRDAGKLFGLFQRIHGTKKFQGTGIGLCIVKKIIEKHGGEVWAVGKPNEGATFFFTLPKNNCT